MASAEDILKAVNASNQKLDQLHADELSGINATNAVRATVIDLESHLDAGFTVLAQREELLAKLLSESNSILGHITSQEDTVMCLLDKIAQSACALLNEAAKQTVAQMQMRDHLSDLTFMYATDHPGSALELARAKAAADRVDACCPPETPGPACQFEPCDRPDELTIDHVRLEFPPYPYEPQAPHGPN